MMTYHTPVYIGTNQSGRSVSGQILLAILSADLCQKGPRTLCHGVASGLALVNGGNEEVKTNDLMVWPLLEVLLGPS